MSPHYGDSFILAGVLASLSCSYDRPLHVCTANFASVALTVLDSSGGPVTGLTLTDSIIRTHHAFTVPQTPGLPGDTYVILDDTYRGQIRPTGEAVLVTGSDSTVRFTAVFMFDVPGGCHVRKLTGPDTLIVP